MSMLTGNVAVEFVRVEYGEERAMDAIRRSELPDDRVEFPRTGGRELTLERVVPGSAG
jgi:hypothetical protein